MVEVGRKKPESGPAQTGEDVHEVSLGHQPFALLRRGKQTRGESPLQLDRVTVHGRPDERKQPE
jgi:hypothetical protein